MTTPLSPTSLSLSSRRPLRRPRTHLLLLLLVLCLAAGGCEEEVVSSGPPPKNPAAAGAAGGGGAKAPAGSTGAPSVALSKGSVRLEPAVQENYDTLAEEPVPEADAARVQGHVWLGSPLAAARIVAPLLGTATDARGLAADIAAFYGFKELRGLELDQPAALLWLDGVKAPVLVLSVDTPDEVLARLPEPVVGRQGNEYSFALGVTRAAYLNFIDNRFMVISTDWRLYPLAREYIAQVMGEAPQGMLARGELDLSRLEWLTAAAESMPAPFAQLRPGWSDTRDDLSVLLGSTGKVTLEARSDGTQHELELRLTPGSAQGGLRTLVRDAEPSSPATLFASLPDALTRTARAWAWQDLRHAPLDLEALPAAMTSLFVALAPGEGLEAVLEAELARSKALAGPTLMLRSGYGDEERLAVVAPIGDRDAFGAATERRAEALGAFPRAALEQRGEASGAAQPLRIEAEADQPALYGLELVREAEGDDASELVVLARRGEGELNMPAETTGGTPPTSLLAAEALASGAKPLLLWVADLAPTPEAQADPVMLGIFTSGEELVVKIAVPQAQLSHLKP